MNRRILLGAIGHCPGFVAQVSNLLYRRLPVCRRSLVPAGWKPAIQQTGCLRYRGSVRVRPILLQLCLLMALTGLTCTAATLSLEQGFENPPRAARPWVYWFWNNGNVTSNGITADLEAMARVGLGGALIMDVVERFAPPPGQADYMSPQWRGLVGWSLQEAARLGLEVTLANGPGWTGSSGPWITPQLSMQKLVWTNLAVSGPAEFSELLPRPYTGDKARQSTDVHTDAGARYADFYADVAVLAFPAQGTNVALDSVLDLTAQLDGEGRLRWRVPPGRWLIQRLGHTTTGKSTRPPVAGGSGLECDKLSREAMDLHFSGMLAPIIAAAGPLAGKSLAATHIDSWEAGAQNWTARLPEEFRHRRGYELTRFLPALLESGTNAVTIGSAELTARFRWDFQQTLSELLAENYVGRLASLAHAHGLRLSLEGYNLRSFGDEATYTARADEPMSEFWTPSEWGMQETRRKGVQMASVAHTLGKPVVGAEAFTSGISERWLLHPALLKGLGDEQFCQGINRFVFHRYAHQPYLERAPGVTMGPWGLHYERTQTWWELSSAWHDYLARCQFLLRRGLFVADLCYLRPEQPQQNYFSPLPAPPPGYRYDELSTEALLARASVRQGRLRLPDGMSYRLLVLPPVSSLTPAVARKLHQLVQQGATLLVNGPPPPRSPSLENFPACDQEVARLSSELWGNCNGQDVTSHALGRGRLVWGQPLAELLAGLDTPPDFTSGATLNWIHRREGETDLYFVANRWAARVETDCRFRVAGKQPELWNPDTGARTQPALYRPSAAGTCLPLHLEPSGSTFVVFRKPARASAPVLSCTRDGQPILAPAPPVRVQIQQATYGPAADPKRRRHVEAKLRALVGEGFSPFRVSELAGDGPGREPWKTLQVDYTMDGQPARLSGQDPEVLTLAAPRDALPRAAELRRDARGHLVLEAAQPGRYELQTAGGKTFRAELGQLPAPLPITGPWNVSFQPGRGAPDSVRWESLQSWSDAPQAGIRHFSGTAVYTTSFEWQPAPVQAGRQRVFLDLGAVQVMARVKLNGQELGIAWKTPFQLEATECLRAGKNNLEITVANLWPNRLIGDAGLPESQRHTWSSWQPFTADLPLLASGLLGPVRLVSVMEQKLD
jgi:hypothetical protein